MWKKILLEVVSKLVTENKVIPERFGCLRSPGKIVRQVTDEEIKL